jgi:dephospho-CoA kinase
MPGVLRVGLTGGIGVGKSTVAGRLADLGAAVVDADLLAREVVEPGTEGLAAVVEAFGPDVLAADGTLDRPALGRLVFADAQARERLNELLHPRIAALTRARIAELPDDSVLIHDVPLLVENRMGAGYHLVIVVHADLDERVRRLVVLRGMAQPDARARVAAQADDDARRAAADVWLDNTGARQTVLDAVDTLWTGRLVPFERNLRLRRAAPGADVAEVVEPDPTWPMQAARLAQRVSRAVGPDAVRVDHVGATAVPGLPTVDVIDLQLVVPDPGRVGAVAPALDATGFVGGEGPRAGVHVSADPGRAATVHVLPARDQVWRDALSVRDWLRADAGERTAYAEVQRAAGRLGVDDFAVRTRGWLRPGATRAARWAEAVGWEPTRGQVGAE